MPYAEYQPDPDLAPFVDSLWLQRGDHDAAGGPCAPTRVLPSGSVDVAFYFRDPFYQVHAGGRDVLPSVTVTGPQTQFRLYGAAGRTGIVLVRFRPGAAFSFFKCPLRDLRDRNVDLSLLMGRAAVGELEERLLAAPTDGPRVALVQQFVRRRIEPLADALVDAAVERVRASGGRDRVGELSRRLGCGRRRLERGFRQFVGLTPKTFSRIIRFQEALRYRRAGWAWAAAAHGSGYHDQAHLCNEVQALAGAPPEALLNRTVSTPLARYFNGAGGGARRPATIYA